MPATSPVWPTKISHQYCFLLCWVAHHLLYQWFSFFLFFKRTMVFFFFFSQSTITLLSPISHASLKKPCSSATKGSPMRSPRAFKSFFFFFFVQFIYFLWLGESKISLHWSNLAFELVKKKRIFFFNSNQALSALAVSLFLCVCDKHSNSRWIVQTLQLILV